MRSPCCGDAAAASQLLDAGDDRGAADLCASALTLFRGDVLPAAGDGDWVHPHRARLEEARMKLVETQFSARLRLGDVGDVIGELEAAVADVPVPGGPVGAADHRAVPGRTPGRCAGDVPAGPEPAGRRARPRPGTAAAAARAADPGPRPVARRPHRAVRPLEPGRRRPGTCRRCRPSSSAARRRSAALSDLLASERLVEIVGPGGVGKTAVAIAAGRRLSSPDGVARRRRLVGPTRNRGDGRRGRSTR